MQVSRVLRRPRWVVALCGAAVLVPAAVIVSGVAATDDVVTSQATPLVDRDYIYGQLFDMSYNDVYRVSGADGDPRNPSDPFNLRPTVNGWQEFFQHWKDQLTDKTAMSTIAKYATVKDHYFHRLPEQRTNPNYLFNPNYPWDSNDAEVTLPGATCPGQRVLLAAHPDGTPVSPTIVGEVNNPTGSLSSVNGFGAGRRTLTLSNIANGGAYDDTSGVTMTMGEYQALLRWYSINGTYPSKTLKIALLDASAGRAVDGTYLREGAKYYVDNLIPQGPQGQYAMFAEMNANGMSYPAYHLGTQYFWNNIANGGVGPWRTFVTDTPSAPNSFYPDVSGSIAANSAAIAAFDLNLRNAVSAGFAQQSAKYGGTVPQENPLRYNKNGSAPLPAVPTPFVPAYTPSEQAQYSPVHSAGTGPEAMASSTQDEASIFWNRGIPGFSVGGVQDSNIDENPYPSTVSATIRSTPVLAYTGGGTAFELASGVPAAGMTTTAAASAVGATNIKVASVTNLGAGQPIFIDIGQNIEIGQIASVGTAGAAGTGVNLTAPLARAHASGIPFNVNQGQPIGFTGDTLEHLNFFASGAPHGLDGETSPTEELLRALELPSQYTALLASGSDYLGAAPAPTGTIAYFETNPVKPASTKTVTFDASFARTLDGGKAGLQYYWDFGDGTSGTGETVTHTYASAQWADVKLVVVKGDQTKWGMYRQAVAVNSPSGSPPTTPPCGTFSAAERTALIAAAKAAFRPKTTASAIDVAKERDQS
ncbi:MAG TPA: PKD domain-containing protein [Gaiellaceae bacterium]|nr:PKD domain-containing protein [Gaiellaceae bacterium]